MTTRETIEKLLEEGLQRRIKFIGDGEHTYYGTPAELIADLSSSLTTLAESQSEDYVSTLLIHRDNARKNADLKGYEALDRLYRDFQALSEVEEAIKREL